MVAVANPSPEENHDKLTTRAAGFGVVKFNKKAREITIECWPRNIDITDSGARQYPGWPRTIKQQDNYGRKAVAYLPTIEVSGMTNPVVQVIDESKERIVYTLRINGTSYRPKVFENGKYTIKVGQQGTDRMKTLTGIRALSPRKTKKIELTF
jgi:ribosomal protein L6P/L9E